jgi:formate/nitrite transporter FocA (FNT family)
MVSLAVVFAYASTSFTGKMIAIWGPTVLFFSQGFEHAVVNMFAIPMGMLLGANVSLSTWWMWNQIPVTLGNLVGGMVFTGLAMYYTYGATQIGSPGSIGVAAPAHASEERARYSPSL